MKITLSQLAINEAVKKKAMFINKIMISQVQDNDKSTIASNFSLQ